MQPRGEPRITVIQPDEGGDLDRMEHWLRAEGLELTIIRPFAGDAVPTAIHQGGLMVLGGAMGARDEDVFPYLAEIKSLLRHAVDSAVPTLGICLGAQLLADAMGGAVEVGGPGLESGVVDVRLLDAAASDELLANYRAEFRMPALHYDGITRLPEDAVLLATGDAYEHQIFRVGSAWGVQFHPEITPARFREWRPEVPEETFAAFDSQVRDFDRGDAVISRDAHELARRFAGVVRGNGGPGDMTSISGKRMGNLHIH